MHIIGITYLRNLWTMKLPSIIPYLFAILFLILFINQCNETRSIIQENENTSEFLNDTISYYTNEVGQVVASRTALQGEKNALETLLSKQIDSTGQLKRLVKKFRKVDAAGNITQSTLIDTIAIPFEVPVPCKFHRDWEKNTEYYSIKGTSDQNGISLNEIKIPNTLSFAIGKKKKGWFSSEYVIEAVNSNPLVNTLGLDSYSIKVPKKRFGVSLFAGYGISSDGLSPIVGIGLGYNLLEF